MPAKITLKNLFHSPMIAHAIIDENECIHSANAAFARFTRYSTQDLDGLTLKRIIHPSSCLPGIGETKLLRFITADGRHLWGESCILPVADDETHGTGFLLQVIDCTHVKIEQQLHKGRAQVLELLYRDHSLPEICEAIVHYIEATGEGIRCSILLLDPECGTLHKAAAPNLPDFYNEAIEGMHIGDGVGSCGTAAFRGERVIVADILNHPYWQRARRLVARTPMRACWSEPIIASDGSILGSFALYYDSPREPQPAELDLITSAASLAAIAISYKRSEEFLRNLDRTKDEFISIAAHELRTPLTAMMGYADLIASGAPNHEQQREYAAEILERGEAIEQLICDLFDVSIIQVGRKMTMRHHSHELLPLIERAIRHYRHNAPDHLLELHCQPQLPLCIDCDAGRMTQAIENLLSNAVKYSSPGSTVRVEIGVHDSALQISISDEGIGMSKDEVQRAFEKYYRADSSSMAPRGLGLGLSIVRQIIEGHGGSIELSSRPQAGTRATLTLPLS